MKYGSAIKNPLTIIAIFAGIAEISGTFVLPFVYPENQRLYIYFLIFFPTLLVAVFFATLNFNRSVLYAPSDWKDEGNFFRQFSSATKSEEIRKIEEEVSETGMSGAGNQAAEDDDINGASNYNNPGRDENENELPPSGLSKYAIVEKYELIENKAIEKLEYETGLVFRRNVRFQSKAYRAMIFDGVNFGEKQIHVAEVKYYKSIDSLRVSVHRTLQRFQVASEEFEGAGKKMTLHFVVVTDKKFQNNTEKASMLSAINRAREFSVDVIFRHYTAEDILQ